LVDADECPFRDAPPEEIDRMDADRSLVPAVQTLQELETLHEDIIRRLDELDEKILKVIAEFQPRGKPKVEMIATHFRGITADLSPEDVRRVA
jgi:hypothetical protein